METFVVLKKPGQPAELLPAPESINLMFLREHISGYIELFPRQGHISELLDEVTLYMDEEGIAKELPDNLKFPLAVVVGPVVACLTNEEGDDHGLCREHADAVALALDFYGVGMPEKAN